MSYFVIFPLPVCKFVLFTYDLFTVIVRPDDKTKGKSVHLGEKREVRCKAFEGGASIRMTIDALGGENPFPAHKKSRRLLVGSFPMYCRRFSVYCGFLRKSGCQAYPRQAVIGCGAACLAPRASAPVSEQADDAVLSLGLKVSAA